MLFFEPSFSNLFMSDIFLQSHMGLQMLYLQMLASQYQRQQAHAPFRQKLPWIAGKNRGGVKHCPHDMLWEQGKALARNSIYKILCE